MTEPRKPKTIKIDFSAEFPMIPVESSNIAYIGYFEAMRYLYIEFNQGTTYRYDNVPHTVYNKLMEAESHGKFLNAEIKGTYEYTKLA